jgi:acetyltransferase-like isoleucine patch superfamily enzyme
VVNLSPGATLAGNVRLENYVQIGMCATVNLQVTVGERSLLGNGCTVKANVPAGTRVRAGTIWPIPSPLPR